MKKEYFKVFFLCLIVLLSLQTINAASEKLIGEIIFFANSDEIKEESLPILDKMAELLLKDKSIIINIKGHTNSIGSPEGEKVLSDQRAMKVAKILEGKGVNPNRITTKGYGGTLLKIDLVGEQNRRAEVVINIEGKIETVSSSNIEISNPDIDKRVLNLTVVNKNNDGILAKVEIKQREKEKVVFSNVKTVNKDAKVEIPKGDGIELLVTASNYVPKKVIVEGAEQSIKVILDKIEKNTIVNIDNIYFRINQAFIKLESYDLLNEMIIMLKENPDLLIEVYGHTDNTSNEKSNYSLSVRRAKAVEKYMTKQGIIQERISSKGFGSTKPVESNYTEDGRKKNRRTEFLLK